MTLEHLKSDPASGAALLAGVSMAVGTLAAGASGASLWTGLALGLAILGLAVKGVMAPGRFDPLLFGIAGLVAIALPWLVGTGAVAMWIKVLAGVVVLAGAAWSFRRDARATPKAGADLSAENG